MIHIAAQPQGISVTDFIRRAARENAEEALGDRTRFIVNEKQWDAFLKALDKPAKDKLRLQRLFSGEARCGTGSSTLTRHGSSRN